jgi:hypothetical protein
MRWDPAKLKRAALLKRFVKSGKKKSDNKNEVGWEKNEINKGKRQCFKRRNGAWSPGDLFGPELSKNGLFPVITKLVTIAWLLSFQSRQK